MMSKILLQCCRKATNYKETFEVHLYIPQVRFHTYTLHLMQDDLASKMRSCLIVRPSAKQYDMACWVVKSQSVLKLRSETLSEVALSQNLRLPRNATKAAKIRALCSCPNIKANCSDDELASIESALIAMEDKKKKTKKDKVDDSEDEEEDRNLRNRGQINIHSNTNLRKQLVNSKLIDLVR